MTAPEPDHPDPPAPIVTPRVAGGRRPPWPFSTYMLLTMILLIIVIIPAVTWVNYTRSEAILKEDAQKLQEQTEADLSQSIRIADSGFRVFDDALDYRMKDGFGLLMAEYERSGRDPSKMDLNAVKSRLDEMMDVYIINESMVIEYSTYSPDIGLDFSQYPYSYEYLKALIQKPAGFYPDRVVKEVKSNIMRKYAYMPTPDHQYIFELGLSQKGFESFGTRVEYEKPLLSIASRNPYLTAIEAYDTTGRTIGNASAPIPKGVREILSQITRDRQGREISDPETGVVTRFIFIDMSDPKYASDTSWILNLTYDTTGIQRELNEILLFHAMVGLIAIIAALGLALMASRYLSQPVQSLVGDIDRIAGGDLDHVISAPDIYEFRMIEQSITAMVATLKGTITQLQQSQAALIQSQEHYRDLADLLPQVVFEADQKGNILFANQYAHEIFGTTPEDIPKGINIFSIVSPEERLMVAGKYDRILRGGKSEGSEFTVINKDGARMNVIVYTAPTIREGQVVGIRGILVDITRLKEVEEQIRKLNEDLERRVIDRTRDLAQANREMESFTYSVSHDLRAPLRAIDGYASILFTNTADSISQENARLIANIRQNISQMAHLIDGLLTLSRTGRQDIRRERVDIDALIREVYGTLLNEEKGRTIMLEISPLPPCEADAAMLKQVISNLLSNAFKFTRSQEKARIEAGWLVKGDETVYYIRDNGIGFDMKYYDKLFGVFQRLHSAPYIEGTGVGLAIAQRIIQRHGGRIWAESVQGTGATFYFTVGKG